MVLVSHEFEFICMLPMKTATSTMEDVLKKSFSAKRVFLQSPHIVAIPEKWSHYFKFATIRNPYDREVSRYYHFVSQTRRLSKRNFLIDDPFEKHHKTGFQTYILNHLNPVLSSLAHALRQNPDYTPPSGCVRFDLDAVVRQETFLEDFHSLPFVTGECDVPRLNETSEDVRDLFEARYTSETSERLYDALSLDFELFDYPKEVPAYLCE